MLITVGIKALNEEAKIEAAISSALLAVEALDGCVLLADSGSSDRTVTLAAQFPIDIVQLLEASERCCGAAAQLAFQHSRSEFFYLLDGDMTIEPSFLNIGIDYLKAHPKVAGVGGHVRERNTSGHDFKIREKQSLKSEASASFVDRLDCGGLYRSAAIRDAGYFADRNLHSFEEFELGARLRARGWQLARINHPAVNHYGHATNAYRLLWRRLRTGYAGGAGEVLRAAFGHGHWPIVLRRLAHVQVAIIIVVWWLLVVICISLYKLIAAPLIIAPLLFLIYRRGALRLGLYSFTAWNVSALGFVVGLFRRRISPHEQLSSIWLKKRVSTVE